MKTWTSFRVFKVLSASLGLGASLVCSVKAAGLSIPLGTVTLASNANITTTADIVLSGGQLVPNAGSLTLSGNWTFTSGTFTRGTSTVTFQGAAGSTSTLSGSTTFYTLSCLTAGKYLDFPIGSTQTVMGNFILQGATGNQVGVRSTTSGTYAYLNDVGANSVVYTNVKDNNASAGQLISAGTTSTDSGHNLNWIFAAPTLGVTLTPATYSFGTVSMAASTVAVSAIVVTNSGNVSESFALTTSSGTTWAVKTSTPTSMDNFVLFGLFNSVQPAPLSFVNTDAIITTPTSATSTVFAGNEVGTGLAASSTVNMWLRLDMPLTTSTTVQQNIALTVTASTP